MILLDTDMLIDFFRGHAACRAWLSSLGMQPVAIPVFVAMELFAGCRNKREQQAVASSLAPYRVVWLDERAASAMIGQYADAHLTHATGINDALIAATALYHQAALHTFNVKHFAAFTDLQTVQPYAH